MNDYSKEKLIQKFRSLTDTQQRFFFTNNKFLINVTELKY